MMISKCNDSSLDKLDPTVVPTFNFWIRKTATDILVFFSWLMASSLTRMRQHQTSALGQVRLRRIIL